MRVETKFVRGENVRVSSLRFEYLSIDQEILNVGNYISPKESNLCGFVVIYFVRVSYRSSAFYPIFFSSSFLLL